jgi:hypothetical protein
MGSLSASDGTLATLPRGTFVVATAFASGIIVSGELPLFNKGTRGAAFLGAFLSVDGGAGLVAAFALVVLGVGGAVTVFARVDALVVVLGLLAIVVSVCQREQ